MPESGSKGAKALGERVGEPSRPLFTGQATELWTVSIPVVGVVGTGPSQEALQHILPGLLHGIPDCWGDCCFTKVLYH